MIERGEEFGFAVESRQPLGIVRKLRRQRLDGHVAVELLIAGAIYLAHSASANLGGDFITADCLANQKRAPSFLEKLA